MAGITATELEARLRKKSPEKPHQKREESHQKSHHWLDNEAGKGRETGAASADRAGASKPRDETFNDEQS